MSTKANLMCAVPPRQRLPQGSAASKYAAARLRRLRPCPSRRPAAVEMGLQEENGDPHAKAQTGQAQGLPLDRDAFTRIDKVERIVVDVTFGAW